ncbi:MAG TPA: GNAT family N-acetyltransferase [Nocardioides sp.]|nr:GNAT family N-acetyltransferase [Nocardioides sp.]
MELRRSLPGELPEVGELTVTAYEEFTRGPSDGYVAQLRDAGRRFREAELWVAVDAGGLLGTVTCCPPGSPWREIAQHDHEGEFRMLAVHPRGRGRGVGTALVRLCEERARAHGATTLLLSSLPVMADAQRIYRARGFRRAPELDWDPVPDVHLVAFRKELT